MKLIVCVAENQGILFNKRRVSRDEALIKDIISSVPSLKMAEYSKPLFSNYEYKEGDDYFFVEEEYSNLNDVDEIIMYKWNRDYPSDTFFNIDESVFNLSSRNDFTGKSHERITKEIWKRR